MTITPIREYRTIKKDAWGEGPWLAEPDKVQWQDEATGLPCLAVRNPRNGNWCGYVGVSEGHPAFGLPYTEADNLGPEDEHGWHGFSVHGGITYAAFCRDDGEEETGICHVPQPGQPDHVYWLGFDTAHAYDLVPGFWTIAGDQYREIIGSHPNFGYRTLAYVQEECTRLAAELQAVAGGPDS